MTDVSTAARLLQVGSGGYSDVHRALLRGQVVAAKVLRVGAATGKVLRSLQHEAYVMSLMSHPNITPFYGGQPCHSLLAGSEEPLTDTCCMHAAKECLSQHGKPWCSCCWIAITAPSTPG
jgi:serine/threonine protein kinase